MRQYLFLLSCALALTMVGCGKDSQTAPSASPQTQPAADSGPPSTQSILDGPRTELSLQVMPLSVRAPQGWKTEFLDTSMLLEGSTPSGDIEIALSSLPLMPPSRIEFLVQDAQHQMQLHPGEFRGGEIEKINGLRAFETLRFHGRGNGATLPSTTNAITSATRPNDITGSGTVSWNLIIFVPRGDQLVPCNFTMRISQDQFNADEAFLRSIFRSAQRAEPDPNR
ncbi:MAG: hypothetical protein M3O30_14665 [Planctomycetota bacterium]|nr:hypothetical protein [Planctomycetota bacterium]